MAKENLIEKIADQMVAGAVIKEKARALLEGYRDEGLLVESAIADLINLFGKSLVQDGDKILLAEPYPNKDGVIRAAGQEMSFAFKELIEARPHMKPAPRIAEGSVEERAFGGSGDAPLKAQGELVGELGLAGAQARALAWGTSLGSTKPGTRPAHPDDKKSENTKMAEINTARKTNPWLLGDDKTSADARMEILSKDTARARQLAAEAGKTIDNKPLRQRVNNF